MKAFFFLLLLSSQTLCFDFGTFSNNPFFNSLIRKNVQKEQKDPKDVPVGRKLAIQISIDGETQSEELIVGLFDSVVPKTTENFYQLCLPNKQPNEDLLKRPLSYIGSPFHRVIKDFMVQGGDFTRGDGRGGKSIYPSGKFRDENFDIKHAKYVLSMANSGPNTNGSQFFLTTAETPWLDRKHVVFARLVEGMDLADKLNELGTKSGKPLKRVRFVGCAEVLEEEEVETVEPVADDGTVEEVVEPVAAEESGMDSNGFLA